jgi:hypothetical protein
MMTSRDFAYWLQGWFELNETIDHREGATPETMEMIKKHLSLVFIHEIDPSMGDKKHQDKLNEVHNTSPSEVIKISSPNTVEEAMLIFGPPPFQGAKWNFHGWEDERGGLPRC